MRKKKPRYKKGDILRSIGGTVMTVVGTQYCEKCGWHYILDGHPGGRSHPMQRMEDPRYIIPPTPAGQVLFGRS